MRKSRELVIGSRFSVLRLHGVTEPGHVQVASRGPLVGGHVADARADEHERAPAVGEAADDARLAEDLPVQPFDHVVGMDSPAMFDRIIAKQVDDRLADTLAQADRGASIRVIHLGWLHLPISSTRRRVIPW